MTFRFVGYVTKKSFWIFSSLIIATLFFALPIKASPFPVITYYFEINDSNWHSATVNISIENNAENRLLCIMPGISGAGFQPAKIASKISDFAVTGEGMKDPSFRKINDFSWLIFANGNRTLIISYQISNLKSPILGNLLSRNFALIDNPATFMMIREMENYPVKLTVSVPYGWKLATGLPFAGDNFEYSALNYDQLARHPLFLAPFKEIYFSYYNQIHFLLFNKSPSILMSDKISQVSQRIFRFQAGFFQEIPADRNFFIFNFQQDRTNFASEAFENASIIFLPRENGAGSFSTLKEEISSSCFRHWFQKIYSPVYNPLEAQDRFRNLWFWLGAADYYGKLMLVRAEEMTFEDFVNSLVSQMNESLKYKDQYQIPAFKFCSDIQKKDQNAAYQALRLKGELLCAILDLKIRSISQNRKSLDDVILFMKRWSNSKLDTDLDARLLQIINSVTNIDFTTFFDLYIHGNVELPFIETLDKAGISAESYADTIPDIGRVSFSNNTILEIDETSPLNLAGIKNGDKILSINRHKLDQSRGLGELLDSLQVGSGNEIMINRSGLSLLINLKIPGREVQQIRILSLEPKTEFQTALRKSWIH